MILHHKHKSDQNSTNNIPDLKILQISHDANLTGAGIAASRLKDGLNMIGKESRMMLKFPTVLDGCPAIPNTLISRQLDRITRIIDARLNTQGLTNYSTLFLKYPKYHILNFHSINMPWFNLFALLRLYKKHTLVYTLHQQTAGTSICVYTCYWNNCERWKIGCGECPQVVANPKSALDITKNIYNIKRYIMLKSKITLVTPSKWMTDFANSSPLLKDVRIEYIPNGINIEVFKNFESKLARRILNLPLEKKYILFLASNTNNPRKGFQHMLPIILRMKDIEDLSLIIVGDLKPDFVSEIEKHIPVIFLGTIRDEMKKVLVYCASDFFILPSEQDNLPNTMLESLACGTPVAAFNVGGIPDCVINMKTGVLSELGDYDSLTNGIKIIINDKYLYEETRRNCRKLIIDNFPLQLQASRYYQLYHELYQRDLKKMDSS